MTKTIVTTPSAPPAIGPYSQGVVTSSGIVYTAGQIAIDPVTGQLVEDDIAAQTRRVLENIRAILRASGTDLDHIVKTTVFLRDLGDFAEMNAAYAGFFPSHPPARSTVEVSRLPRDVRIEIEAIAVLPDGGR